MTTQNQPGCSSSRRLRLCPGPHHVGPLMRTMAILFWMLSGEHPLGAEAQTGTVVGHVTYAGPSVPDEVVEVTRDRDYCGRTATTRTVSLDHQTGGLEEAVVSIDAPTVPVTESPTLPVVIANSRCTFSPRIAAAQVGQPVEIRNDDPVMHNTHLTRDARTFLNVALVPAGRPIRKPLAQPGIYSVKCDAHKFMKAHVVVFPHAYFAVTDTAGAFRIPQLPPGDHTITIWHHTLGTIQRHITVPVQGKVTVMLQYPANGGPHDK